MDDERKQLHLRPKRDQPVLKFSNSQQAYSTAQTSGTQRYADSGRNVSHTNSGRPPAVPLFQNSDVQLYKQQMYSHFINNYAPVYTPNQMGFTNSHVNNRAAYNNFSFMTGPGTPSGQGITPAHLLANPLIANPQSETSSAQRAVACFKNPYARPISAQEVLGKLNGEPGGIKGLVVSAKACGSTTSLSSWCSQTSLHSTASAVVNGTAMNKDSAYQNGPIQTNSFMRPQSAAQPSEVDQRTTHSRNQRHGFHANTTPLASPSSTTNPSGGASIVKQANPLSLKPHITRPPSAKRPGSAASINHGSVSTNQQRQASHITYQADNQNSGAKPAPMASSGLNINVQSTSVHPTQKQQERHAQTQQQQSYQQQHPVKHANSSVANSSRGQFQVVKNGEVQTIEKPPVPSARSSNTAKAATPREGASTMANANRNVPNSTARDASQTSQQTKRAQKSLKSASQSSNNSTSGLVNQFQPRSRSRPGSSAGSVSSTEGVRVRTPNYSPGKPYEQIIAEKESGNQEEKGPDSTNNEVTQRTNILNALLNGTPTSNPANPNGGGAPGRNMAFSSHTVQINPQMFIDGRVKEMPVTHTLTGTIYYGKSSKAEDVIHPPSAPAARRTVADGAPSAAARKEAKPPLPPNAYSVHNTAGAKKNMAATPQFVTSRAEETGEWEDEEGEEDEEEGADESSPPSVLGPAGERLPGDEEAAGSDVTGDNQLDDAERLPGDGEAAGSDVTGDNQLDDAFDEDDEDVLDNLEDEEGQSSDDSEADSRQAAQSQAPLRLKSATKRMLGLSISDTGAAPKPPVRKPSGDSTRTRLSSTGRRPVSVVSTISSDSDLQPALMPSLFPGVPPTVNFVGDGEKVEQLPWEIRKFLRWKMSPITPNVVKNCIARSGFRQTKHNHDWIGYWGKHMKACGFKTIREYQKVNHFPGSFQIGRKDRLWRNLCKLQVHFGKKEFSFFPQTFVLPCDMKLLKRVWEDEGGKQKWIVKPPASARGIGIKVIHKWNQIPKKRPVIVQKYLAKPYLINDSKFDMRIYVYVTSYDPLRIYLYEDGLVRFASVKYSTSLKNINNRYMHLTNYSIQKKSSDYKDNNDESICQGHKWGIKALWGYLRQRGVNTSAIWDQIKDLVVKTIIASDQYVNPLMKANVRRRYSCHELFGFDVMLDDTLKPWIIEVNISPSLHSNSPLDMSIKGAMIRDLLNIAGFMIPDKNDMRETPGPSNTDNSKYVVPNEICQDKRLWSQTLSSDERVKHAYYGQRHSDEAIQNTILETLTPEDIRLLVESADEESRRGNFERVFPAPHTAKYLRYFEAQRYSNLLMQAWINKYARMNARGIAYLETLCAKGIHLENPTADPKHQWAPPNTTSALGPACGNSRVYSAPSKQGSNNKVLPQLRRNKNSASSTSSQSSSCPTTRSVGANYDPH